MNPCAREEVTTGHVLGGGQPNPRFGRSERGTQVGGLAWVL